MWYDDEHRRVWGMWLFPGVEFPYDEPPVSRWEKGLYIGMVPVAIGLSALLADATGAM
jgi:hypothetical protein